MTDARSRPRTDALSRFARGRLGRVLPSLEHLAGGIGTAVLAFGVIVASVLVLGLCVIGVGVLLVVPLARIARAAADRERSRLRRLGRPVPSPATVSPRLRDVLHDRTFWRELAWAWLHGTLGLLTGAIGVLIPISAVRDLTFPLWWQLLPRGEATPSLVLWSVTDWPGVIGVVALGSGWVIALIAVVPLMAEAQALPGRWLLRPSRAADLSVQVIEVAASRAEALDAHAVELRRIERALHDGSQNRLIAVSVLLATARRAADRDPASVAASIDRAQDAVEVALAELRAVARSILPPVLQQRGLVSALRGIAADSAVPCRVEIGDVERCAATVEATAYFAAAEALTNIARHSGASTAALTLRMDAGVLHLRIDDDGVGGASPASGSGLEGIRRRVVALDGRFALHSPAGGPTRVEVELPCGS